MAIFHISSYLQSETNFTFIKHIEFQYYFSRLNLKFQPLIKPYFEREKLKIPTILHIKKFFKQYETFKLERLKVMQTLNILYSMMLTQHTRISNNKKDLKEDQKFYSNESIKYTFDSIL